MHAALARGVFQLSELRAAVDVEGIGRDYAPGVPLSDDFHQVVAKLTEKAAEEALDGAKLK